MMTMWPAEVRGDLRNALQARSKDDLILAQQYLERSANSRLQWYNSSP